MSERDKRQGSDRSRQSDRGDHEHMQFGSVTSGSARAVAAVVLILVASCRTARLDLQAPDIASFDGRRVHFTRFDGPRPQVGDKWVVIDAEGVRMVATTRAVSEYWTTCAAPGGPYFDVTAASDGPPRREAPAGTLLAIGPLRGRVPRARIVRNVGPPLQERLLELLRTADDANVPHAPSLITPAAPLSPAQSGSSPRGAYDFDDEIVTDLEHPDGDVLRARHAVTRRHEVLLVDLDGDSWPELVRRADGTWWQRQHQVLHRIDRPLRCH